MPYRYGVMRIDAVASVQHLRDSIATKQAEALDTKEYLVYLDEVWRKLCRDFKSLMHAYTGIGPPLSRQPMVPIHTEPDRK